MVLALENVAKSYGDAVVLQHVTFELGAESKVGLVGANGVGKSTLLEIVARRIQPDAGRVRLAEGAEIGYLPQTIGATPDTTVEELLDEAMGALTQLEDRLRELEARLASGQGGAETLQEYGRLQERYERRGGYVREHRMQQVLAGLGVEYVGRSSRSGRLSGGERARLGLAALLLQQRDLLLLDEPTNHLDFGAIEWLETYLSSFAGAVLVVSHDRHFLNRTVASILEIDEHARSLKSYAGDYDFYAAQKAQERVRWQDDYERQQDEIQELRRAIKGAARQVAHNRPPKDTDKFLKAFKAGRIDGAISRNVRSAEEKLRRIEEDPIPRPPRALQFDVEFDPSRLVSHSPLSVSGLCKRYGEHGVLCDVSFAIGNETRAVIVGPNGAGKSTLLKILAGLETADAGVVDTGGSVVLGYLDQQQETLPQHGTAFDAYRGDRVGDPVHITSELLALGLLSYAELGRDVSVLSVGQKRKLQIARLIALRANVLLLDEPTNHVSLDVLEQFEDALLAFPGPVIAVSHDRRFIDKFANEIWELRQGTLHRRLGSWSDYWQAHRETALTL